MNYTRERCEAMIVAGIKNPESHKGIVFCTEQCPYEYCVVFENTESSRGVVAARRRELAKRLKGQGKTVREIAVILGVGETTVKRYLRK